MVYLGPIEPRSLRVKSLNASSRVNAVTQTEASQGVVAHDEVNSAAVPGFVERRKQDRRKNSQSPMVETRGGKDRRKGNSTIINVSV